MLQDLADAGDLHTAVTKALQGAPADGADTGTQALALAYAKAIDEASDAEKALSFLGPKLLDALAALRCTPASRTAVKEASGDGTAAATFARLRQGARGTPHLHSAPTGSDS